MIEYRLENIPVDKIIIQERIRQDLGNITELSELINHVGLLQPIGVNQDYVLIYGQRRLEAVKKLDWEKIPGLVWGKKN